MQNNLRDTQKPLAVHFHQKRQATHREVLPPDISIETLQEHISLQDTHFEFDKESESILQASQESGLLECSCYIDPRLEIEQPDGSIALIGQDVEVRLLHSCPYI